MGVMKIGEVAEKAGLRASALRYYERIGLLPAAKRESGQRRYTDEMLTRLAGIKVAQQAGFSVEEIKQLFYGFQRQARPSKRWAELARAKLPESEALIRRTRAMKTLLEEGIRCGCSCLEECSLIEDGTAARQQRSSF